MQIEALLGEAPRNADEGRIDNIDVVRGSYVDHVIERFGNDLEELRIGVDCANGAYSGHRAGGVRAARRPRDRDRRPP